MGVRSLCYECFLVTGGIYFVYVLSFIVCCRLNKAQAYMVSDKFDCFMSNHIERDIVSGHLELENN